MSGMIELSGGVQPRSQLEDSLFGVIVAGTYRVAHRLGSGGMGEIRAAEHVRLGRPVAIKFLRAGALVDPKAKEHFRHEARRASAVRSEHVVKVFDYGELEDETPYLVMERLFGEDLRSLLARDGALAVRRAVKLVLDACRGLSAVHAAGLVHRDLKPANLFVEGESDLPERCVVLDFGVAKSLANDTTRPGTLVGTIRYMAPEQLVNASSVTVAADVYALGAILYEALTGVPAHTGGTIEETMFDILHRDVRNPAELRPMPAELAALVMRMLARSPARRFARIDEVARALVPFAPVDERQAERSGPADVTARELNDTLYSVLPAPPARKATMAAALCVACSVGVAGGWYVGAHQHAPEPPPPVVRSAPALSSAPVETAARSAPSAAPAPVLKALPVAPEPSARATRPVVRAAYGAGVPTTRASAAPPLPSRFDPQDPYE
jgi:serine/threonine-protein kinase